MPVGPVLAAMAPYLGQAAVNIGTGVVQGRMNRRAQERQFGHDIRMWNMMNKYNHPKNQVSRLMSAGLNPDLMYGQASGGASGNTQQFPRYQAEQYQLDPIDIAKTKLQISQASLSKSMAEVSQEDKALKAIERKYQEWFSDVRDTKLDYDKKTGKILDVQGGARAVKEMAQSWREVQVANMTSAQREKIMQETKNLEHEEKFLKFKATMADNIFPVFLS